MISVLFSDPKGPYPKLGVDCWDEKRDAFKYKGRNKIIAHPPCGPWGFMSTISRQDPNGGPFAVDKIRRNGGVLEHPAYSKLFGYCKMPQPGCAPDKFGGFTIQVNQVSWGHPCMKPTWLYLVGVRKPRIRVGGSPTHIMCTYSIRNNQGTRIGYGRKYDLPVASKLMRRLTPVDFAKWLIKIVSS